MGDGYDTLVLKAASLIELQTNYKVWLEGLLSSPEHGIELIDLQGVDDTP